MIDGEWVASLRDRVTSASGVLVCLDFDGTLAPIVDDPDAATVTGPNRELLRRLSCAPDATLGFVSGRSLSDLRERVGLDDVYYAGNHGLEWGDGTGRTVRNGLDATRPVLERAVEKLRSELDDVPGCTVEDKDVTATVHYRRTPDDRVPEVVETVENLVEHADGLRTTDGKDIVELRPDVDAGKDVAVEHLRERYPDHVPLFVGDDVTDEDGFRAVADDGFGVLVGDRRDTAASVRVSDTEGVAILLGWVLSTAVQQPDAAPT